MRGLSFVPDGSAMYITSMNASSQDFLHKYTFSTIFDISTVSSGPVGSFQMTNPTINNYLSGCIVNAAESKIAYDPYTNTDWYQQDTVLQRHNITISLPCMFKVRRR